MRGLRRLVAATLSAVLVTTLFVAQPAIAETGPSEPLPDAKSAPVGKQTTEARPRDDDATKDALHGDQPTTTTSKEGSGTPTATPLSPSATWKVSEQTGDFSWSYPLRVPPAPGGLEPKLALSYLSSAVDGRTSATNNQASWVGDGWDLSPGFVERVYLPCVEDDMGDAKPEKGDLCWRSDNATAVYNGSGGMLIRDDDHGFWRLKNDDGSRVERLVGAANKDNDGEYWKITTVDGTQYFFGSRPEAGSTWTVPVFGDDSGEPCHSASGFDASHCVQAWRWNLDKVVDRNGNQIVYTYAPETNSYGMNMKDAPASYVRGGTLQSVQYGFREGQEPSGEVVFTTADRCVRDSVCTKERTENWPDVPWKNNCDTAPCKDLHAPTFWSTKRLAKITTRVRRDGGMADVDAWELNQEFPKPGDGEKASLWLQGVKHVGLVGGSLELPSVTFEGAKMANRVYTLGDGYAPLIRYRVTGVVSESGGVLSIVYEQPDCTSAPTDAKLNVKRCFPAWWAKEDHAERLDYFQKYVVKQVVQSDRMGTSGEQVTSYEYLDGAGWHYDTSEFVKESRRTYNDFRGFGRVNVRSGRLPSESGPITKRQLRFYRGMNGDKDRDPVNVQATEGDARADEDWLQGQPLETIVYNGDTDEVVSKVITEPTSQGPTATRGPYKAYIVRQGTAVTRTALAAGGWRTTQTSYKYDQYGLPTEVADLGDTSIATDDRCITTTYARNTTDWLVNFPSRVETDGVACTATPVYPRDGISDVRTAYDGQKVGDAPTKGNATITQELETYPATEANYVTTATTEYDEHGRVTKALDALGRPTTTAYTPRIGGPVTKTVVTNARGHAITTDVEPAWGQETLVTDANDNKTETKYDALGRTVAVWLPNRPRKDYQADPSSKFAYKIDRSGINVVTTTAVGPNGDYTTTKEIFDGLLRPRQKQVPAVGGGRVLSDIRYDSQGRAYKTTRPYYNDQAIDDDLSVVDDDLWSTSDVNIPGFTVTMFDGAGRKSAETFHAGAKSWTMTMTYGGDRVSVTPPSGGTPVTTISDVRGHSTELRQYHGAKPEGDYDATSYTYTNAGKLASITDPAGNVWRYTYDLRGRQRTEEDPDTGTTTLDYDKAGQLISQTTGRGTLTFTYDDLGRKTSEKQGDKELAAWTYDTAPLGKGKLASSTRYTADGAYKRTVDAYTALYDQARTTITIPEAEQTLAGSYTTEYSFNVDGSRSGVALPKAGDLDPEDVTWTYDGLAHPKRMESSYKQATVTYVDTTTYTRFGEPARVQLGLTGKRVWQSYYYQDGTRRLDRTIIDAEVTQPKQADLTFTYDDAGNITSIANRPTSLPSDVQCFRYDYLQRLKDAWTPGGDCTAGPSVAALAGPAPYWQTLTYDKAGNRDVETQHAATGDTVRDYSSTAHRLDSVTTGGTTLKYGYNTNGDMTTRPGQQLDWDVEGHLAKVTEGAKVTSFVYDADGARLIRRDPTGSTLYLGDQEVRLDKATGRRTGTRYYQHGDRTVAMRTASGLTWLAGDHQGTSQLAVTTGETLKVTQRRQTPFGGSRGTAVSFPGEKGFVGGTADASTGLTHLGAREYDPSLGRFISADPIMDRADPQQMNAYAYGNNNPVTHADPTGLWWDWIEDIGDYFSTDAMAKRVGQLVTDPGTYWKDVGQKVATTAKHAAPIAGTLALVVGSASPFGVALGAVALISGGINIGVNCGAGKPLDCMSDVAGMIPVAGKAAVGLARSVRYTSEIAVAKAAGDTGAVASAAAQWEVKAGTNPLQWINRDAGAKVNRLDVSFLVAGDGYYAYCDLLSVCPDFSGSQVAVPGQASINLVEVKRWWLQVSPRGTKAYKQTGPLTKKLLPSGTSLIGYTWSGDPVVVPSTPIPAMPGPKQDVPETCHRVACPI